MSELIIGVDLGGTRIRAARLDPQLNLIERHETLTHAHEGLDATIERIKIMIRKAMPDDDVPVAGIGISVPGPLNPATGVVVRPPNLAGWHNVPLGHLLYQEFGVPIYTGNDANVAALAEVARGAARGYRHAIYLTVSTGIGSGIIYDGRLLLGQAGLAGEAGHMVLVVNPDSPASSLEKEAAGPALARQAQARMEGGEDSLLREMVSGNLEDITAEMVGKAAIEGDPLALSIVRRCGRIVGMGIANLLHIFNPEVIVIGGGVSNIGDILFDAIWQSVREHALDAAYWQSLKIERAALKGDVSIIGAAALVVTQGGQADVTQVLSILNK